MPLITATTPVSSPFLMVVRLAPSFFQLAAACFLLLGCSVHGYSSARGTCYSLTVRTPPGSVCPGQYRGTGRTCYEALAAVGSYQGLPSPADFF